MVWDPWRLKAETKPKKLPKYMEFLHRNSKYFGNFFGLVSALSKS